MTVQTSAPPAPRKRRRGVVTPYDFRRPTALAREHTRALEVAFETFARQWSTLLLTRLRTPCQVTLSGVTSRTYDEYVRSLPGHSVLVTFTPAEGSGPGLVQLDTGTALDCVDFMLGGRGGGAHPERELTEIEFRLLRDLVTRSLADMAYALAGVLPLEPAVTGIDYNPQFLQAAAAADVVVIATLGIALGEDAEAVEATIMLPTGQLLARLRDAGDRARSVEQLRKERQAADVLSRAVPELPVEVSARFAAMTTRPAEVLALSVGDVLRLPHPTTRPLDVVTADVVLARAVAGTSGHRLACLVVSPEEEKSR
ncbi:flagellar motor switch protein FliM [Quadrisphaera sp. DSM 44207]|uniref:flagellar motor switch protein FliM n=1 Tax=Quadrisphaera sp. DSM 44207 TaxID=1881057 RepID=UPI000891BBA6|nr:flagellar motor switch protein FliM [Quadrisphaera sp. DSM 44207]SDQ19853.1 flagellar motor switch protein FliM [Quadrisphaera sp. DSM 44207]